MLTIRADQMATLEEPQLAPFVDFMVDHLRELFAEEVGDKDHAALCHYIREGIEHARRHGIVQPEGLLQFLNVRVALGEGFDTDPRYPWAATTLDDETLGPPEARVEELAHFVIGYLYAMERNAKE